MTKLKKGNIMEAKIKGTIYPNTGLAFINNKEIRIKNTIPGQKIRFKITRVSKSYLKGKLLEVKEPSPLEKKAVCPHYKICGGCNQQTLEYNKQLEIKEKQVKNLLKQTGYRNYKFNGIVPSPDKFSYRNKMEFTFGDLEKGGTLQLGLHPRGRRFDIITVDKCQLVDEDFGIILKTVLEYARAKELPKYHFILREGFLRHLVVRKGINTGEVLVNLVTTSQLEHDFSTLKDELINLKLKGQLVGFLQTINDDYADAVKCDRLIIHHGRDYYYEKLLGLKFKVKPFSFFQPNTKGAEKLYQIVRNFAGQKDNKLIYDLYCGTGTISQVMASHSEKVFGIELVEEAVEMARENAMINGLDNCKFIAGDVLEKIEQLEHKPDLILIDPPRPGIHPKALSKIIALNAPEIIYVSCNPKSLARDLKEFREHGYDFKEVECVDMFPHTGHVETVVLLQKEKNL